jgi:hypothetical protein
MSRLILSVASTVLLLPLITRPIQAQSNLDSQTKEKVDVLVKSHRAWSKLSTPNASINAKEVARQGAVVQYHFFVQGLPTDEVYTAYRWPVGKEDPEPVIEGVSIGKDGVLMCAGRTPEQCVSPEKKDDPIEFTFAPAKGEPYRLAFAAPNSRIAFILVPDPIEGKDKGCTLSVVRLTPKFELAYFRGSGFPPNAEVQFDGQSYDEKHSITTKTDADGNLEFAILPAVLGHSQGTTTMKAVGKGCSPSLHFDWGS